LSDFCKEHKIELVALYSNATHILQPLDVALFRPLKAAWKKTVDYWRLNNEGQLRKEDFAPVLKTALDSLHYKRTLRKGFETCGLYPFSANAVNYKTLNKVSKKKE